MAQRFLDSSVFHRPLGRDLPTIARAEGALLWDTEGRRYIDGSGGAVVVNVGHGRREIAAAMARQAEAVAYVHGTQFTSEVLETYARRLAPHVPMEDPRLYLVSGGSEANETAVKMARAYQLAVGQASRHKVIRRSISYHGNTLATLSLSGRPNLQAPYRPMLQAAPGSARRPSATTARSASSIPTAPWPARTRSRRSSFARGRRRWRPSSRSPSWAPRRERRCRLSSTRPGPGRSAIVTESSTSTTRS